MIKILIRKMDGRWHVGAVAAGFHRRTSFATWREAITFSYAWLHAMGVV
jgi:hypothetical protein